MTCVALARHAMATRFEIVAHGEDERFLRAAGEEALEEIERLDAQLSLYRSESEISRINFRAAREPVRVEPVLFQLLQWARRLHEESLGVFDITVAPLMRCWGFMHGTGQLPDPADLAEARGKTGMHLLSLNEENFTIRFARPGVMLDLGSIGKGFALERAAMFMREAGVTSALLHGGTSTACAIGAPPEAETWKVAIDHPNPADPQTNSDHDPRSAEASQAKTPLAIVPLKDEAISVSAVWGKAFEAEGRIYGHVLDPRTGQPAEGAVLAAVVLASATESDAFSTALLTLGPGGLDHISALRPHMRTLVVARDNNPDRYCVLARDINLCAATASPEP